jgi:antiviral helicase SKI2
VLSACHKILAKFAFCLVHSFLFLFVLGCSWSVHFAREFILAGFFQVPLEHFLFLGDDSGGGGGGGSKKKKAAAASEEQLYKLVDERGTLLNDGYRRALRAKSERESEHSKAFGARDRRGGRPGSDKGLYVGLVSLLERMELRPCVVFTFSKKRCETNADGLGSLDLTTAKQKSEIHVFIQVRIRRCRFARSGRGALKL